MKTFNVFRFYDVTPFRVRAESSRAALAATATLPAPMIRRTGAEFGGQDGADTWNEPARPLEKPFACVARE